MKCITGITNQSHVIVVYIYVTVGEQSLEHYSQEKMADAVDSTIGNDTFFVTWTIKKKPEIVLQDPKEKKYKTSDFKKKS